MPRRQPPRPNAPTFGSAPLGSLASGCPGATVKRHTGKLLIENGGKKTPHEEKVFGGGSRTSPPLTESRQIIKIGWGLQSEKSLIRNRRGRGGAVPGGSNPNISWPLPPDTGSTGDPPVPVGDSPAGMERGSLFSSRWPPLDASRNLWCGLWPDGSVGSPCCPSTMKYPGSG